ASCATQGIAWLFGPFLTFANEDTANVLGWFFIIFNGLEGLWIIILYIIVRSQHMDEQKRVIALKDLTKSTNLSIIKREKRSKKDLNQESSVFNDLYDLENMERMSTSC
ncbi:unnamed protein product, partial [Rotaria sordida]